MAMGYGATNPGIQSIAIGNGASVAAVWGAHAIGFSSSATQNGSIAIGYQSVSNVANNFVAGSENYPVNTVYFGKGISSAAPTAYTLAATNGTGTNIAGGDLQIAGGKSTGTGAGGSISFQTAAANTSGSMTNALAVRMRITSDGNVGIGTAAPGAKLEIAGTPGVDGIKFPDGSVQTTSATGHILITHELPNATYAGSSVVGWQTRPLNIKKIDTSNLVSLSSNQVTFTAGTYYCQATAPAFAANSHKLRLRNVTDGVTLIVGNSEYGNSTYWVHNTARLVGQFTITSAKALELQHYITTARATDGLGTYTNSGEVEVYAILECWKN
jgi:hypothetical protein